MAQAILGVPALSWGMPSPSHQGFFSSWAVAARDGRTTEARAAAPIALIKSRRERTDLMDAIELAFFHERLACVQIDSGLSTRGPKCRK